MVGLRHQIDEAVHFIRRHSDLVPRIGMILGSGLGDLADDIQGKRIPFAQIPHFPPSTVAGHKGHWVMGELEGRRVVSLQGRIHYYEGYSMYQVTFPVRLMKALGTEILIVTNSCGGIRAGFRPGDLMLITDHINLMGDNPLIGPNDDSLGSRFPDMSEAYHPELLVQARTVAKTLGIPLHEGVYAAVTGPNYETRAELRYIERIGGDAVGMSTVPETIVAVHENMKVLGLSCITDVVDVGHTQKVNHEDVLKTAKSSAAAFGKLIKELLKVL
ncbi:MAG: purine-nucleoside phosphorylase [Armatimonadetes bacterium]|nr:purine-nucleoside phosphorylase [Armatimonadota bacterium]